MSQNPLISVIIPIYNVEKYLKECLDSATEQSLHDIEIICINDGSSDACGEILESYAQSDKRIIAIHRLMKVWVKRGMKPCVSQRESLYASSTLMIFIPLIRRFLHSSEFGI